MPIRQKLTFSAMTLLVAATAFTLAIMPSASAKETRSSKKGVQTPSSNVWVEFVDQEKNKKGKQILKNFMVVKPDMEVDGRRPPYIYFESASEGPDSIVGTVEFESLEMALRIHESMLQAIALSKTTNSRVTFKITGKNIWAGQLYGGSSIKARFNNASVSIDTEF